MTTPPLPLSGIVVLDLTQIYAGPYATFLMAMAGAEVIKIEPRTGENLRSRGDLGGVAYPFAMLNANKKPVTLPYAKTFMDVPIGDTLLYFDAGGERAFIAVSEGLDMADVKVGARMALALDPRRLCLFDADGRRLAPS